MLFRSTVGGQFLVQGAQTRLVAWQGLVEDLLAALGQGRGPVVSLADARCRRRPRCPRYPSFCRLPLKWVRTSRWTIGPAPTPAEDLTRSGSFPLSAVTGARPPRVTTPPGSSTYRGKTSCPQRLAQPRTTRDHQQGNGRRRASQVLLGPVGRKVRIRGVGAGPSGPDVRHRAGGGGAAHSTGTGRRWIGGIMRKTRSRPARATLSNVQHRRTGGEDPYPPGRGPPSGPRREPEPRPRPTRLPPRLERARSPATRRTAARRAALTQIGRASCRERV